MRNIILCALLTCTLAVLLMSTRVNAATSQARPAPLVVLISIDGFRADYLARGVTPTLSMLARRGARAKGLEPSFPSVTFPNHYSIVTGLYPDHHGIALFQATEQNPAGAGLHHLAFEVPTLDDVFKARAHLRKHNAPIDFDGRRRAGVQIAVEFRDPDGHRLEIYWGIDQIAPGEAARPAEEWKGARSLEAAIADPVKGQDTTLKDPGVLQA